jgi:GTP cyclohydrolase I
MEESMQPTIAQVEAASLGVKDSKKEKPAKKSVTSKLKGFFKKSKKTEKE